MRKVALAIGYAWLVVGVLDVLAVLGITFTERGFTAVQDLLSPFNVFWYLFLACLLGPGAALVAYGSKGDKAE
jgi:hypothetical protein